MNETGKTKLKHQKTKQKTAFPSMTDKNSIVERCEEMYRVRKVRTIFPTKTPMQFDRFRALAANEHCDYLFLFL